MTFALHMGFHFYRHHLASFKALAGAGLGQMGQKVAHPLGDSLGKWRSPTHRQPKAQCDIVLERLNKLHPKIIDLELTRVQRLLERVGSPEKKLPPVIHDDELAHGHADQ